MYKKNRIASYARHPTSGALRLTGKKVLTTVARASTISVAMVGALFATAFGALSFLMGVGMALFTVLRIRRMVWWVFRRTPAAQAGR
ncbi:hypothetical protein [Azospirillum canadense]|uniref:hypothetical protein n=1 Tax=Azospirillum canadense TaxID=403962 RepID=UPI0022261D4A|nr:hypothetical protein [Azospirillum canadense]MCW2241595.1 hypothetical protein [Azospirillum canadense]